jgi:hypothetical protein
MDEQDDRITAFAQYEEIGYEDAEMAQNIYNEKLFEVGRREYLVVTDEEADELWDAELESYLDEPGIVPGADSPYFDRERWKSDARMDGRAHSLNRYDGGEDEVEVNGETYYIYRQN